MTEQPPRPVVVVTGSTRGIGAAIARAHADAGAAAQAEADRAALLAEQGDDANDAGTRIDVIRRIERGTNDAD